MAWAAWKLCSVNVIQTWITYSTRRFVMRILVPSDIDNGWKDGELCFRKQIFPTNFHLTYDTDFRHTCTDFSYYLRRISWLGWLPTPSDTRGVSCLFEQI